MYTSQSIAAESEPATLTLLTHITAEISEVINSASSKTQIKRIRSREYMSCPCPWRRFSTSRVPRVKLELWSPSLLALLLLLGLHKFFMSFSSDKQHLLWYSRQGKKMVFMRHFFWRENYWSFRHLLLRKYFSDALQIRYCDTFWQLRPIKKVTLLFEEWVSAAVPIPTSYISKCLLL